MSKTPIAISWSGGKDSCMMLQALMNDDTYDIVELHTAVSSETGRVSMHGISKELIEAQAKSIGLPIYFISIEADSTNKSYEKALHTYYSSLFGKGIKHIGFGDIFLEDLKAYRDSLLHTNHIQGVYPLWKKNTAALSKSFLELGFKTTICCSNQALFDNSICGELYSKDMLASFSAQVDPCGENGEFHTFATDGPIFSNPINIEVKDVLIKEYNQKLDDGTEKISIYEFADIRLIR